MKKIISITLALLLTLGITAGVYNDANATEINKGEAAAIARSEKTGLKKAETVCHDISEEEYEAVVAREEAESVEKYTDPYWSQFSEPYYNYVDKMTAEEREIYDKIYDELYQYIEGGTNFSKLSGRDGYYATPAIACGNIDKDTLDYIHYVIIYEHPELYYLDTLATINETSSGNKTIQFEVFDDFAKGADRTKAAKTYRESIEWYLSQVNGKTFYDKEKQIHDLVCENAVYSYTDHSQSAYSALVEGETVCAGYSEGFNLLCHAIGIPAMSVTSSSHEWSQVRLGNTWYAVDVTWDDEDEDGDYGYDDYDYDYGYDYNYRYATGVSYEYFNKSDKTITYEDENEAHQIEEHPWNDMGRPKCPKDYTKETDSTNVYRLYNSSTGEHFYTTDSKEKSSLEKNGWKYEDVGWITPVASYSETPVYRLYSPAGDHHYTTSFDEKEWLVDQGWTYEDVCWYSTTDYGTPLYRLNNPNASVGAHHYTTSEKEREDLEKSGWVYEGIGWYGM